MMAESGFASSIHHKYTYQKIQILDITSAVLIAVGNIICYFQYEHEYAEKNLNLSVAYLVVVMMMTLSSGILTFFKMKMLVKLKIFEGTLPKSSTLVSSGIYKQLLGSLLVYSLHPYPFLIGIRISYDNTAILEEVYYHLNDFFHMASNFRMFFIIINVISISGWRSNSASRIW